jgi:hypothetical protein
LRAAPAPADPSPGIASASAGEASPAGRDAPRPARPPVPRYLGFDVTSEGREYTLQVTRAEVSRHFRFLIRHASFAARHVRFQDAPDLCYQRLERELSADPDLPAESRFELTGEELLAYRDAHQPGVPGRKRRGAGG